MQTLLRNRPLPVPAQHLNSSFRTCSTSVCHRPFRRIVHLRPVAAAHAAPTADLDVAVVGGGPAGLAAAHALSVGLPGARIAVYERVPELMKRGAGFSLDVNGQKALQAIKPDLLNAAKASGKTTDGFKLYDNHGKLFKQEDAVAIRKEMEQEYGYSSFILAWSDLQRLLAERLPSSVPLHLGQQLERYEEAEDGTLTLHLAGHDSPTTAKLLVAADGYFSKVRQQCLADGPPAWAGTAVWRATVDEEFAVQHGSTESTSMWYAGDFLSSLTFLVSGGQAVWVALAPEAKLREAGIDFESLQQSRVRASAQAGDFQQKTSAQGKAAKERCLKVFDKFPEPLKNMFRATDAAAVVEHGIYTRPAEAMTPDSYGRGRVVIIGDASHPMRPTGQGLNSALEDAYHLGYALAQAGSITNEALTGYRSSRAQRMIPIIRQSDMQGQSVYRKDAKTASENARPPPNYEQYCYGIQLEPISNKVAQVAAVH